MTYFLIKFFRCPLTGLIATGGGDDCIKIFREEAGSSVHEPTFTCLVTVPTAHSQDINCVKWHPKTPGLLATCSDDGDIKLWRFQDHDGIA